MVVPMSEQTKIPGRAVASAKAFVAAHGRPTRAVVERIGRAGARVVLVGNDGALGDIVVSEVAVGEAVVGAVTGVQAAEWDRETTAAAKIGPRHRRRMAAPKV
jgi:hypothetical protein